MPSSDASSYHRSPSPQSVQTIGTNTFDHCDGLTEVTLPAYITRIGYGAFKNCVNLTRVNILREDAPITLGADAFNGCHSSLVIVAPTPAYALQYKEADNWSDFAGKIRAKFGNHLFNAIGTVDNAAYEIANETDLRNLAAAINDNAPKGASFRQTADITLGNTNFTPISKNSSYSFSGIYDGGGYTISGLHISQSDGATDYGLFGYVDNGGTVKNVRLVSPIVNVGNVDNSTSYGALIGRSEDFNVENCVVLNPTVEGNGGNKGAIIGSNNSTNSTLQNLYFYEGNCDNAIGYTNISGTNVGRARKVTIGSGISSVSPDATDMANGFVYNSQSYYREGLALTLTSSFSEETGYHISYKAENKVISNPYTVNNTDGDVTLTAEQIANTYTVHFDGNGSTSGSMSDQAFTYGTTQNLTANAFTRTGYTFAGWATSTNGNVVYTDKESVSNLIATNGATVTLYAKWTSVSYIDANGDTQTCTDYTVLTSETNVGNLSPGWYVVESNVSYSSQFYCNSGDIHLILCDGAKMTVEWDNYTAIYLNSGSLTIYAQSTGSSMGQLEATSSNSFAIYAYSNVTICGGCITARSNYSNGIGSNGNITIHSGQISATGGGYGIAAENVTLGLRNATDYITANKYYGHTYIADGQMLTDDTNLYSGMLDGDDMDAIAGKTLRRTTQTEYIQACLGADNDGSAEYPYTISAANGWNAFCLALQDNNTWNRFSGKTVKLANSISVTTMAGSDGHEFCGTFDGNQKTLTVSYGEDVSPIKENNAAPFRNLQDGCIIKNLHVKGHIYTWFQFAGGLAGTLLGTVKIENCLVSTVIHSYRIGDGTHGGIVGRAGNQSSSTNLTIEGCVFDGKLLSCYSQETTKSSGFVGLKHDNGTVTISNSLYAPAALGTGETEITSGSATFIRNGSTGSNCYYTRTLGDAQGTAPYIYTTKPTGIGTEGTTYSVSGITAYTNGIKYNGKYYTTPPDPAHFAQDGDEYTIKSATGWDVFCDLLADGETFSGKTVKLGDNISVTRMAGSNDHRFMGTFDGQGNTLTVSYENTGNNTMTAPFSYVDGATIQNLVVGGSITDTGYRAAGIIGETSENLSHITNCMSSVNISGNRYIAGFSVGGNVAIEGCVFNGKIVGTQYSGGFVGWSYSGLAITNCLFAPQDGSSISGGTFYYNGGGGAPTPTNSYYTTALGTPQGKAKHTVTAGEGVNIEVNPIGDETATYSVSGITAYAKGITRTVDETTTFYYGQGDDVSLTLSNTAGEAPLGYSFSGYTASAGTLAGTENLYTLTMTDEDVTVTATFSPISYTIGYDLAGGSVETDNPTTYTVESDAITLSNPTREGYTFAGWTGTGLDAATMSVTIAKGSKGNKTFYAIWSINTYTITYNLNGGTLLTDKNSYTIESSDITLDSPTRTGYTFLGWYNNEDLTGDAVTTIAHGSTGNVELWAKWAMGTISYIAADGDEQGCSDYTVLTGSETSLAAGWYVADGTLNYSSCITLNGDVHLILKDGAVMNIGTAQSPVSSPGISVDNCSISIYAQSTGDSKGQLTINASEHGIYANGGNVEINDGKVTTTSTSLHGIFANGGNVEINGGEVEATGGYRNDGIYAEQKNGNGGCITINSGKVTATSTSGYGIHAFFGNITLGWTDASDYIYVNSYTTIKGTLSIASGKEFIDEDGNTYSGTIANENNGAYPIDGKTLRPSNGPRNLTVTNITTTSATLTWEAYGDETQWQVSWSTDNGSTWSKPVTVTQRQYELTGLSAGSTVRVKVQAVLGEGFYSTPATCIFDTALNYLDKSGFEQTCSDYTVLTGNETRLAAGWYVAEGTLNYSSCITLNGDVHLILKDGAVMNVGTAQSPVSLEGISANGRSISIYAQSTGDSKGQLTINASEDGIYANGGNVEINGGKVTATSTSDHGIEAYGGNVEINGGEVDATGATGGSTFISGIYAGKYNNNGGFITLSNATVTASGDIGIYAQKGGLIINSGTVTANGVTDGIYAKECDLTINGGKVTATATLGYGIYAQGGNITLGWTDASDYIYANSYSAGGTLSIASGKDFIDEDGIIYNGTIARKNYGAYPIDGKTLRPCLQLSDNADNGETISDFSGKTIAVQLQGRTLYKDGAWNTLCLPFGMTAGQVTAQLAPTELKELDTNADDYDHATGLDGTTLYLNFKNANEIRAGAPYIIKWNGTEQHLVNPVFTDVTISKDASTEVPFTGGSFVGTYAPREYSERNTSILFLGANNTLYYPQPADAGHPVTIGVFRAYFDLGSHEARAFVLNFGGKEIQGITTTDFTDSTDKADGWYTLDGKKLDKAPTRKGLYIQNGRKVVVK